MSPVTVEECCVEKFVKQRFYTVILRRVLWQVRGWVSGAARPRSLEETLVMG